MTMPSNLHPRDASLFESAVRLLRVVADGRPCQVVLDGEEIDVEPLGTEPAGPEGPLVVPNGAWTIVDRRTETMAAIVLPLRDGTWAGSVWVPKYAEYLDHPSRSAAIYWCLTMMFPEPKDPRADWTAIDPATGQELATVDLGPRSCWYARMFSVGHSMAVLHPDRRAAIDYALSCLVPEPSSPDTWGNGAGQ